MAHIYIRRKKRNNTIKRNTTTKTHMHTKKEKMTLIWTKIYNRKTNNNNK